MSKKNQYSEKILKKYADLVEGGAFSSWEYVANLEDKSVESVKEKYKTLNNYVLETLRKIDRNVVLSDIENYFKCKKLKSKFLSVKARHKKIEKKLDKKLIFFCNFYDFCKWFRNELLKKKCDYCKVDFNTLKILFEKSEISSFKFTATPHIERKEADRGYCSDNCVLICSLCNNAKSDMILENDFREFIAPAMAKYYKYLESKGNK